MPLFTKNPTIEAVQFNGKNQDELIALIGKQDGKNSAVKKGEELLMIDLVNTGPTQISIGQYLVKEGGVVRVMNEKEFLATYDPA